MILFNGVTVAQQKETQLKQQVAELITQGKQVPHIVAILFTEDTGSVLYTSLKQEAAERVGMQYSVFEFSMTDPIETVLKKIAELNSDPNITGIIIQKPYRKRWEQIISPLGGERQVSDSSPDQRGDGVAPDYFAWWSTLTSAIAESKDVDGLHPSTLEAIKRNTWRQEGRVLPATCKAVLSILEVAFFQLPSRNYQNEPIAILGRSDILGQPLFYELRNRHYQKVQLMGQKELKDLKELGIGLTEFSVIVTATGQRNLITAPLIADKSIVIDVGEPQPDVEYISVSQKAAFLTPVPGGVGPMTIVSLLENAVELAENH